MNFDFKTVGDVTKVTVEGRLVASCSEEFKDAMFERLRDSKRVVMDLQKMAHIDSSGLGALVSVLQWVNSNGGSLKLFGLQSRPKIVFEITKVYRVFEIFETEAEALASFNASAPSAE